MRAAHQVLDGKWDGAILPATVIEFLFAKTYGWDLNTIRRLPANEAKRHLPLLILSAKFSGFRL
jgi:hypothetical protein